MRFIVTKDYQELSQVMAQLMLKHMHSTKKRVNIAITTGETPVEGYKLLAAQTRDKAYFNHVHYYIFDEFWYKDEPVGICRASLDRKYFNLANVTDDHIHNLTDANKDRVDDEIKQDGGLDLVLMGIGTNGHFCGNQPQTFKSWDEGVHTIDAHATKVIEDLMVQLLHEDLNSDDETRIPEHYITMGPKTIMAANSIVFILSGKAKAETARKAFFEPITQDFPVSIFQLHQDVTVILDQEAASEIIDKIK